MKKAYLLLLLPLLIAFTACEKEELAPASNVLPVAITHAAPEKPLSDRQINQQQAAVFARTMRDAIVDDGLPGSIDRHGVVTPVNLAPAEVSEVVPVEHEGERVMYVVNFGTDEGFIVLSADKVGGSPIMHIAETGHLSAREVADLDPKRDAFSEWFLGMAALIHKNLQEEKAVPEKYQRLWQVLGGELKGRVSLRLRHPEPEEPQGDEIPTDIRIAHGRTRKNAWYRYDLPVPKVIKEIAWGQSAGYNADAKIPGALAGCPAVAVGILCRTLYYPEWYDYDAMPTQPDTPLVGSTPISRMLRDIADHIPNYHWGLDGSGAIAPNILKGVKALGYDTAKLSTYNISTAWGNMAVRCPVLLMGDKENGGHIWISHGYRQRELEFTIEFWLNFSWELYALCWPEEYFYMHWGWYGQKEDDGWTKATVWPWYKKNQMMIHNLVSPNVW